MAKVPVRDESEYKQVIIIRTDLGMSTGKLAAQACHACLGASEQVRTRHPKVWRSWMNQGGRKIVVGVRSEEELIQVAERAGKLGLPRYLVEDMGLTEIPPGSVTALGIGPERSPKLDKVSGNLPLLK